MQTRRSALASLVAIPVVLADGVRTDVAPEQFGAIGDGIADDAHAFAAMFSGPPPHGRIVCRATGIYRIGKTVPLKSGTSIVADGTKFIHTARGAMFDLTSTSDVSWKGGDFYLHGADTGKGPTPKDCPAFQLSSTTRFTIEAAHFRSARGDKAIKEISRKGEPPTTLIARDCIFEDSSSIWGGHVVESLIERCTWRGSHLSAVTINSNDKFDRIIHGLTIKNCTVEHSTYIAFEIKFSVGIVFEDNSVGGARYMAVSLPSGRAARVVRCQIANLEMANSYGLEMPGDCSEAIVAGCSFQNVPGTAIHFGMDTYGYAHNIVIKDNTFDNCSTSVSLFRGRRCLAWELSASTGSFERDDILESEGQSFKVVGFDADRRVVYVAAMQPTPGKSVRKVKMSTGSEVACLSTGVKAIVSSTKKTSGNNIPALEGWSRGTDIDITGNHLVNSGPLMEFESGCLRTRWINNVSHLTDRSFRLISYRGEDYLIQHNEQYWDPRTTPEGSGAIIGDIGAGEGTILDNSIWAGGKGSFLFGGYGQDVIMKDNTVYDSPHDPFSSHKTNATFKLWEGNRTISNRTTKVVKSPKAA